MYLVIISPRAEKELKNISKIYRRAIAEVIEELSENPFAGKLLSRELTKRYSYKIGVFRVIYKVNEKDKTVLIITAGHRATVYK